MDKYSSTQDQTHPHSLRLPTTQPNRLRGALDELLTTAEPSEETYILGDINICLSKYRKGLAKSYLSMLKSHGFNQLIDQPTRVAECSSVLDHIICNSSEKYHKVVFYQ